MDCLLSGPSYSLWGVILGFPDWSMILNHGILFGVNDILTICRMCVNVIYCSPVSSNLMSCGVWMICGIARVVSHGGVCDCVLSVLHGIILTCFYSNCACPIVVIWSSLCASHDGV